MAALMTAVLQAGFSFRPAAVKHPDRHSLCYRVDQPRDERVVAANIPARLQTKLVMDFANLGDGSSYVSSKRPSMIIAQCSNCIFFACIMCSRLLKNFAVSVNFRCDRKSLQYQWHLCKNERLRFAQDGDRFLVDHVEPEPLLDRASPLICQPSISERNNPRLF